MSPGEREVGATTRRQTQSMSAEIHFTYEERTGSSRGSEGGFPGSPHSPKPPPTHTTLRHLIPHKSVFSKLCQKLKRKLTKVEVPACRTLQSTEDSLSTKGFLRCQKSYDPPKDLSNRLEDIFRNVLGRPADKTEPILNPSIRYSLFTACFDEFKHGVPNSILHMIRTYADLLEFYQTPVDSTLPLDKMKKVDLPPNLHIQLEPMRFLPDEDTMFKGQTAFPESNTLVTGLRTRKKFKGHKVTDIWKVY